MCAQNTHACSATQDIPRDLNSELSEQRRFFVQIFHFRVHLNDERFLECACNDETCKSSFQRVLGFHEIALHFVVPTKLSLSDRACIDERENPKIRVGGEY